MKPGVWEHLALTRAQVITDPEPLAHAVEALRMEILKQPRDAADVAAQTAQMRARIAAAKSPEGVLDAKIGAGRLQDIELFAQAGALIGQSTARDIPAGLAAARRTGLINGAQEQCLNDAYGRMWALQAASRLLSAHALRIDPLREAARDFLIRAVARDPEGDTVADLEAQLGEITAQADEIITAALAAAGPVSEEES